MLLHTLVLSLMLRRVAVLLRLNKSSMLLLLAHAPPEQLVKPLKVFVAAGMP